MEPRGCMCFAQVRAASLESRTTGTGVLGMDGAGPQPRNRWLHAPCCAHAHSTRRCVGRMFGVEVDLGSAAHAALRANLTLLANLSDPDALSLRGVCLGVRGRCLRMVR